MTSAPPQIAHPARLVAIDVEDDRSLRIVLQEQTGLGPEETDEFGWEGREIVTAPGDGVYELRWDVVVCFAVRGDPFPAGGPSTATLMEGAEDSPFLVWVRSDSHADPDYVAAMHPKSDTPALPLRHWLVSCNEALFDVAAPTPPKVRRLRAAEGPLPTRCGD
jgi:hypothetical protein